MACTDCPIGPGCLGLRNPRLCELQRTRADYRQLLFDRAGLNPALPIDLSRAAVPVASHPPTGASNPPTLFNTVYSGRIRLGFLSTHLHSGGAEAIQLQQLRGFDPTIFQFVGMVVKDPADRADPSMLARTSAHVPVQFGLDKVATLAGHCDILISWVVEDLRELAMGKPVVYIDHFPHNEPIGGLGARLLADSAAIVGVSSLCSPAWTDPHWNGRYSVIPNAVDPAKLVVTRSRGEMLAKWGVPQEALVAGSYCRIHPNRRPATVVQALPHLPEPWHTVLIGEATCPDERQRIENLVSQMPPATRQRIHVLPADPESGNVLSAFDVVVSDSPIESFGLTLGESLWLGQPVVARESGLAKIHPEFFYLIEPDAVPGNVADSIQQAQTSGCPVGAQEYVQDYYSPTNWVAAWTKLLRGLVEPKAMPSFLQLGKNFGKAVVGHALGGFEQAGPEVQADRMAICRSCTEYFEPTSKRCSHPACGCWCNRKTAWKSESCPIGKW